MSTAPGRVAPNEFQYAFITPRAAGVVRSVTAQAGQEVKAGEVLATIDSPEVGVARLDLYTKDQALEIANSQADREEMIFANTLDLLKYLKMGETPERVHEVFENRAVGENREKLMTAYAQYRLARTTIERNRDLFSQKLITPKDFDQVNANFEVAQATYQSLMDEMGYEVRLQNIKAQQAKKQAETAVRAAQERLRILGVKSDGTEPEVEGGKVVGVEPNGPQAPVKVEKGRPDSGIVSKQAPVSTYSIWAPFDGTILDREMIVPGVAVDTTHRIFTMANLDTVWVEANVQESDFAVLDRTRERGAKLLFRSPAYPDRVFEAEVIHTGDQVDEKSRSIKLLAKAPNDDRLLRPGMFVEAEVLSPRIKDVVQIPESALLTEENRSFVYVKTGTDRFVRRGVEAEIPREGQVSIRSGLAPGEEVVAEGGYKLKAMAVQLASSEG